MKQFKRIEQLANSIVEIDCNGLRVQDALVHLELSREDYKEFVDEWKNTIPSGATADAHNRFGLSFNGIDFSIVEKRH